MHHEHDTYSPGADWREEAGAWDTATAALGRWGSEWAKGAGRTYRWKDYAVTLYDPSGEVAKITRTARAEVDLVIRGGIARRHPTAQNAIIHARVMLGMTKPEDTVSRTEIGPGSIQLLNDLSAYLCGIFGNLTFRVTATALTLIRNGTQVFRLGWDGTEGAEVWQVSDRLANPSYDAAMTSLAPLVADIKRRHPVPVPVVRAAPVPEPDAQHTHDVMAGLAAAWVGPCVTASRRARLDSNALVLEGVEAGDDADAPGRWVERARVTYSTMNPNPGARFAVWTPALGTCYAKTHTVEATVEAACAEVRRILGLPPAADVAAEPLCALATDVSELCEELVALLDRKNKAYGDSARKPLAVFSRLPAIDRLAVRIDDKLSRIARGSEEAKAEVPEDTVLDLIGYLMIYLVESRKG